MDSVSEIKKKLIELGISTSTPGVFGDDRLEELNLRLELSTKGCSGKQSSKASFDPFSSSPTKVMNNEPSGVNNLSLAELRGRLAALGENTSTPGISGEERRLELIKRLKKAICGTDSEEEEEEEVEEEEEPSPREKYNDMPAILYHRDVVPSPPIEKEDEVHVRVVDEVVPIHSSVEPEPEPEDVLIPVSEKEISELKGQLKRISTKRAVAIANRLSAGSEQQDEELKKAEKLNLRIDAELQRVGSLGLKSAKQQGFVNINHSNVSSVLIESGNTMFSVESLKSKLTALKERTKTEIKEHRQRIREDELNSSEHGIVVEESLNNYLKEVNLNKGRVRRQMELRKHFSVGSGEASNIPRDFPLSAKTGTSPRSKAPAKIETAVEEEKRGSTRNRKAPNAPAPLSAQTSTKEKNSGAYDGSIETVKDIEKTTRAKAGGKLLAKSVPEPRAPAQYKPKQKPNQAYQIYDEEVDDESEEEDSDEEDDDYMYDRKGNLKPPKEPKVTPAISNSATATDCDGTRVGTDAKAENITDDFIAKEIENLRIRKASGGVVPTTADHPYVKFNPKPPAQVPPPEAPMPKVVQVSDGKSATQTGPVLKTGDISESNPVDISGSGSEASESEEEEEDDAPLITQAAPKAIEVPVPKGPSAEELQALGADDFLSAMLNKSKSRTNRKAPSGSPDASPLISSLKTNPSVSKTALSDSSLSSMALKVAEKEREAAVVANKQDDDSCSEASDASDSDGEGDVAKSPVNTAVVSRGHDQDAEKGSAPTPKHKEALGMPLAPATGNVDLESEHPSAAATKTSRTKATPLSMNELMAEVLNSSNAELERMKNAKVSASDAAAKMEVEVLRQSKQLVALGVLQEGDEDAGSMASPSTQMGEMFSPGSHGSAASTMSSVTSTPRSPMDAMALAVRIKGLLRQANVYWDIHGDIKRADKCYTKALDLDPTNLVTLTNYATFLHRKMGENMHRVEALYKRGIQMCLPDLLESLESSTPRQLFDSPSKPKTTSTSRPGSSSSDPRPPPAHQPNTASHTKISHLINLLCSYASFLQRAKGDLEAAGLVYTKAMMIDSNNGHLLRQFSHFLAEEQFKMQKEVKQHYRRRADWEAEKQDRLKAGEAFSEEDFSEAPPQEGLSETVTGGWQVEQLYTMALKRDKLEGKENPATILGFAKYLRKVGKLGQAELMYSVAFSLMKNTSADIEPSDGVDEDGNAVEDGGKTEKKKELVEKYRPMAICNYATFLFERHRRAYAQEEPGSAAFLDAENGVRRAREMFTDGLSQYSKHRGLQKNYKLFAKSIQQIEDERPPLGAYDQSPPAGEGQVTPEKLVNSSQDQPPVETREDGFLDAEAGSSKLASHVVTSTSVTESLDAKSTNVGKARTSAVKNVTKAQAHVTELKSVGATKTKGKVNSQTSRDKINAKAIQLSPRGSATGTGKTTSVLKGKVSSGAQKESSSKTKISPRAVPGVQKIQSAAQSTATTAPVPVTENDDYVPDYGAESNHNDLVGLWSNFSGFEEDV